MSVCESIEENPEFQAMLAHLRSTTQMGIGEKIAEDGFGLVIKGSIVVNGKDWPVAIKFIKKKEYEKGDEKMKISWEIRHDFIVSFYNIVDLSANVRNHFEYVYMAMELCCGSLQDKVSHLYSQTQRGMEEADMKLAFRQLIEALDYLNSLHICHRDIKCNNILLDKFGNVKLTDFGLSRKLWPDEACKTSCGTPSHMAPEVAKGKEYKGQSANIFSVGTVMFYCAAGYLPFSPDNEYERIWKQMAHKITFLIWVFPI